ncbi:MAG: hypothetical protein HQ548_09140, partial [Chloroflexi bacterium]|nr:hypothetical protein [Chloroflexota bacterium]
MSGPPIVRRGLFSLLFVVILVSLAAAACGSETAEEGGEAGAASTENPDGTSALLTKILDLGQVFTFDDFLAAGFKKGREYNVEGLEAATAAYYGFYGLDPYSRQEYEARFYESHADAIEFGIPMADEVTGEGAMLRDDNVTWHEGLKDRRQCLGLGTHSHHTHSCNTAK